MLFAISSVLIFLLRLRFPSTQSIFATIRGRYGADTTKDLRQWEKTAKQLVKVELDEILLRRCHTESVIPKFLRFRLYRQNLDNTPVYRECQVKLLENEIDYKRKVCKRLRLCLDVCKSKVKDSISWFDFVHASSFIEKSVSSYESQVTLVHKRKFISWGGSYNPTNIDSERCIFNFSDYVLGNREKFLISLGLNFCVPCFYFPKRDVLLYFEYLLHRLKSHPFWGDGGFNEVVGCCKAVMGKLPKLFKYTYSHITKSDVDILKKNQKEQ